MKIDVPHGMTPAAFTHVHWRSRDGLRLHARRYAPATGDDTGGRGTVVCIPGLTRNAADFDAPAQAMAAAGWQVFAVDLRGRAGSQRAANPRSYNPRTYADDVAALLDDHDIASAVFVGTSLGVLVTMTVAVRRPSLVAAAVVNDAGPEVPREALDRIGRYAGKPVPPGYNAHLGLLYAEGEQTDQMLKYFEAEKALYPESASYMDFLLAKFKRAQ